MKKLILSSSSLFLLSSGAAFAHVGPGTHDHGPLSHGLGHMIADFGLLALLTVLAVGGCIVWMRRRSDGEPDGEKGARHDH